MRKPKQPSGFEGITENFETAMRVKNWSDATIAAYTYNLGDFFLFLKAKGISDAKKADAKALRDYHAHVQSKYLKRFWSVCMKVRAVKRFYEWLRDSEAMAGNPSSSLKEPSIKNRIPRSVLSESEAMKMLNAPDTSTSQGFLDKSCMEILYGSGLRVSELTGLDLGDVDLKDGLLRVRDGKGKKDRLVPLTAPAVEILTEYISKVRKSFAKPDEPNPALWLNRNGGRLSTQLVCKRLAVYGKQIRLKKRVSPHIWRHTFATTLVRHGVGIRHVQEMLGHSRTTDSSVYFRIAGVEVKEAHQKSHPRSKQDGDDPTPHIKSRR